MKFKLAIFVFIIMSSSIIAQESETQDRESMAMDATATQWSFQTAYQTMPSYYNDDIGGGVIRPQGLDNYFQLRIVAPVPLKSMTILPRLTIRHYENLNTGESGFGNTELFALIVPKATDWGNGRAGIGPLVTAPGNENVAKKEWGYGLAAAIVNTSGQWFYGLLFTQSFKAIDPRTLPAGSSDTNPLGIAPFVAYRFGTSGMYLQTGDIVALYSWDKGQFYLPFGARFGKVFVFEKSSINIYAEYLTSAVYKNWDGPAVKESYRINFSYTLPVGI